MMSEEELKAAREFYEVMWRIPYKKLELDPRLFKALLDEIDRLRAQLKQKELS